MWKTAQDVPTQKRTGRRTLLGQLKCYKSDGSNVIGMEQETMAPMVGRKTKAKPAHISKEKMPKAKMHKAKVAKLAQAKTARTAKAKMEKAKMAKMAKANTASKAKAKMSKATAAKMAKIAAKEKTAPGFASA